MSNKVKEAEERCTHASDGLQRAAQLLEQAEELYSNERIRLSTAPPPRVTPTITLVRDSKGVLRVKKS